MRYWISILAVAGAILLWFREDYFTNTALAVETTAQQSDDDQKHLCLANLYMGSMCHKNAELQFVMVRGQLLPMR